MGKPRLRHLPERGAVLVQVGIAILVLLGFSALVVDYGVLWVARGQAQNAADAGALAGATALAFDDFDDRSSGGPAVQSAMNTANRNPVFGQAAGVIPSDVTFPTCPDGTNSCVRVDVYRNQDRGNALPVFFARLFGVANQGVRATATAQAVFGQHTNCMKPWIIPDRWEEHYPPGSVAPQPWVVDTSTFQTQLCKGQTCTPVQNPDVYRPPTDPNPTGFRADGDPNDIGLEIVLKEPQPSQQTGGGVTGPGWVYPVRLNEAEPGGAVYRHDITYCSGEDNYIGETLRNETGIMVGPTFQGVDALIAADPYAIWNPTEKIIENSCQTTSSCDRQYSDSEKRSPRLIAVPVFDPSAYEKPGAADFKIVNILGFFIEARVGNTIRGVLVDKPALMAGGADIPRDYVFLKRVTLVR